MIHRVLVGGTASGKKLLAAELHGRHGLRPLSMDSMKVYTGMDVGTDKPDAEVRARTDYGLLDLAGHDQSFSSGRWIEAAVAEVERTPGPVLFAGGTPLYLRLLLQGLFPGPRSDPALRAALTARWEGEGEAALRAELAEVDPELERRLLPGDMKRVLRGLEVWQQSGRALSAWQAEETRPALDGRFLVCALRQDPAAHAERVARRVDQMFEQGLLEEVRGLLARAPFAPEPGRSIGYHEAQERLAGRLDAAACRERTVVRTRQLARKQRMFLSSFEQIRWVDVARGEELGAVCARVEQALEL